MSTQTPTPETKPDRPLLKSDLIDCLARLENGFQNCAEFWRTKQDDSHGIAQAMMSAMTECKFIVGKTIGELLDRP